MFSTSESPALIHPAFYGSIRREPIASGLLTVHEGFFKHKFSWFQGTHGESYILSLQTPQWSHKSHWQLIFILHPACSDFFNISLSWSKFRPTFAKSIIQAEILDFKMAIPLVHNWKGWGLLPKGLFQKLAVVQGCRITQVKEAQKQCMLVPSWKS